MNIAEPLSLAAASLWERGVVAIAPIGAAWLWMAGAITAALVVVALHRMSKRSPARRVVFPPARLLARALARGSAWRGRVDRGLVALRALAAALLVLSFAGLAWNLDWNRALGLGAGAGGAGSKAGELAIVLDASASMARASGGVTLFEKAREEARREVSAVGNDAGRVRVIIAGMPARLLSRGAAGGGVDAERALAAAVVTNGRADLEGAVGLARGAGGVGSVASRILVLTDRAAPQQAGPNIEWRQVGAEAGANVGIVGLGWSPALPKAGERVRVRVQAARTPGGPASVLVRARAMGEESEAGVGGESVGRGADGVIDFGPDHRGETTLELVFDAPGDERLEAVLVGWDDGFAGDDRRRALCRVSAGGAALLLGDEEAVGGAQVEAALRARHEGAAAGWVPSRGGVTAGALEPATELMVLGAGAVDDESLRMIAARVRAGATLLWWVDSARSWESLAALDRLVVGAGAAAGVLGPARGMTFEPGMAGEIVPVAFDVDDAGGSAAEGARAWRELERVLEDMSAAVRAAPTLVPADSERRKPTLTGVLAMGPGGEPLLWCTRLGAGNVCVAALSLGTQTGSDVAGSVYLPLLIDGMLSLPTEREGLGAVKVADGADDAWTSANIDEREVLELTCGAGDGFGELVEARAAEAGVVEQKGDVAQKDEARASGVFGLAPLLLALTLGLLTAESLLLVWRSGVKA